MIRPIVIKRAIKAILHNMYSPQGVRAMVISINNIIPSKKTVATPKKKSKKSFFISFFLQIKNPLRLTGFCVMWGAIFHISCM